MFAQLKRKLVLLYGITTSIILLVILGVLYYNASYQAVQYRRSLFQKNVESISNGIASKGVINHTWIAEVEKKNDLYLYIEENGRAFEEYSKISELSKETADQLIQQLKEKAMGDGMSLFTANLGKQITYSGLHELKNDSKTYLSQAILIPTKKGDLTIFVFALRASNQIVIQERMLLYGVLAILGILFLFGISTAYIGQILKPLEQGQKKQVEFVAAASHELRSPMTVIQAGLTSIEEDPAQLNHFLPMIQGESRRMTGLIQDLLTLATADAKAWSLKKQELDVETFLIDTYDYLCCIQDGQHGPIDLKIPEEPLHHIQADAERLRQVLLILVDNSWNYTDPAKGLTVSVNNYRAGVRIQVADYGPGIPENQRKLIFERFYQGNGSRTDKAHYGLGLSIAKEIVTLHGGKLYVTDTPGGGATFVIEL